MARFPVVMVAFLALAGCGRIHFQSSALDSGVDAAVEAGSGDGAIDTISGDATNDSAAADVGSDAPRDTGSSGDADASLDAGTDTSIDALIDASIDDEAAPAGPPPDVVVVAPYLGFATGSVRATSGANPPLRPRLHWRPSPTATRYEVQMDDSCAADTFRTCTFPSPEIDERATSIPFRPVSDLPVSMTAPVGRRYAWRVRACNVFGCSSYSETRYLDVGRLRSDFNGDGFGDLAVGDPVQTSPDVETGRVYVYYGSSLGIGSTPSVTIDNPAPGNGRFGSSVASAGDLNGDGFSELVVGATFQSSPESNEGTAFLFFGGAAGLGAAIVIDNPADQPFGRMGTAVAGIGDVDGDGFGDLAVSAAEQGNPELKEGNTFVYYGSGSGTLGPPRELDNPFDEESSYFGNALCGAGDVNGDGYPDLAIGANRHDDVDRDEGAAFVFHGGPSGIASTPSTTLANPTHNMEGYFGTSLAFADGDGDGLDDLAVGASFQSNPEANEGVVYVYRGRESGVALTPDQTLDNPADQAFSYFGASVARVGDWSGDGYEDLVIGAPSMDNPEVDEGTAYVYAGSASGFSEPPLELDNPLDDSQGGFGTSVGAPSDVDGNGRDDVLVGAPGESNPQFSEGNAFVFEYVSGGFDTVTIDHPEGRADAQFGVCVSR